MAVRPKRDHQVEEAARRQTLVQMYTRLQAEGRTPNQSAAEMQQAGIPVSRTTLDRWRSAYESRGFDGLLTQYENSGRRPKTAATEADRKIIRAGFLRTNVNRDRGSVPESIRAAQRRGALSPAFAAEVESRADAGLPLAARALARESAAAPALVHTLRSPKESRLRYANGAGVMRRVVDPQTLASRRAYAGEGWESDDGTINLAVCIPWPDGGCATSERYKVKVGRFQWLPMLDIGSGLILGYSYTCRPKGSYRAEDVLSLMHTLFRAHGVPRFLRFERGTWESESISSAMALLGIERWTAYTAHQKLIEGCFHSLWTKLSSLPGQVGRYRGEEEEAGKLLQRCRTGAADPREHFPMLGDLLQAFDSVVAEKNATRIVSPHYGEWIPSERWARETAEHPLRGLDASAAWVFSPCRRELTVQGNQVSTRVAITDDWSVPFVYASPQLAEISGCKIRLHFDPFGADSARATVVLAEDVRDLKSGQVYGEVLQISQTAREARRLLQLGEDADHGREVTRSTVQSLRREVKAITAAGDTALSVSESRDGRGGAVKIETEGPLTASPEAPARPESIQSTVVARPRRSADPMAPISDDEYQARRTARAQRAQARRRTEIHPIFSPA